MSDKISQEGSNSALPVQNLKSQPNRVYDFKASTVYYSRQSRLKANIKTVQPRKDVFYQSCNTCRAVRRIQSTFTLPFSTIFHGPRGLLQLRRPAACRDPPVCSRRLRRPRPGSLQSGGQLGQRPVASVARLPCIGSPSQSGRLLCSRRRGRQHACAWPVPGESGMPEHPFWRRDSWPGGREQKHRGDSRRARRQGAYRSRRRHQQRDCGASCGGRACGGRFGH
ncbi:hypothetical protein EJF18_60188 [Clavispora lusitaniae]|uniref:Uncharacterized protein n=1 Tax=Clavispora lusitaniae TaxID=36911 RepID=A0ACD0WQQ8_CLALS|nr:hypothetical protein EJF14_60188 [Clavispora lusitaniae]QFZ35326.1 hypothetical protein EJF16_60188 [Clavispora lusitaniae]QFZ41020.1 hypothetical protein EJF15_60188 [Clavispora lusitaniae]QFZ46701.1 hypothetical protein EJF18_60188 [Clavispora lusitaniae]QFZ52366.1 hypothetical protein EJF17_60188 [Clavispora lusitaniae]